MKVIRIDDLLGGSRDVDCPKGGFKSIRGVLESDGMGFSVHKTIVYATDEPQRWHYKNHLEACYCVYGRGLLESEETGERHWIEPDTVYLLDNHDPHRFMAVSDTCVLISIFNPPCSGREIHDSEGSY